MSLRSLPRKQFKACGVCGITASAGDHKHKCRVGTCSNLLLHSCWMRCKFNDDTMAMCVDCINKRREDEAKEIADAVMFEETADAVMVKEIADVVTADETANAVTLEETADAVMVKETADAAMADETADAVTVDETADAVMFDETADAVMVDETADAETTDETAHTVMFDKTADAETADDTANAETAFEHIESVKPLSVDGCGSMECLYANSNIRLFGAKARGSKAVEKALNCYVAAQWIDDMGYTTQTLKLCDILKSKNSIEHIFLGAFGYNSNEAEVVAHFMPLAAVSCLSETGTASPSVIKTSLVSDSEETFQNIWQPSQTKATSGEIAAVNMFLLRYARYPPRSLTEVGIPTQVPVRNSNRIQMTTKKAAKEKELKRLRDEKEAIEAKAAKDAKESKRKETERVKLAEKKQQMQLQLLQQQVDKERNEKAMLVHCEAIAKANWKMQHQASLDQQSFAAVPNPKERKRNRGDLQTEQEAQSSSHCKSLSRVNKRNNDHDQSSDDCMDQGYQREPDPDYKKRHYHNRGHYQTHSRFQKDTHIQERDRIQDPGRYQEHGRIGEHSRYQEYAHIQEHGRIQDPGRYQEHGRIGEHSRYQEYAHIQEHGHIQDPGRYQEHGHIQELDRYQEHSRYHDSGRYRDPGRYYQEHSRYRDPGLYQEQGRFQASEAHQQVSTNVTHTGSVTPVLPHGNLQLVDTGVLQKMTDDLLWADYKRQAFSNNLLAATRR